jgi:sporulation protein YlmC with PRC-barrel domain
MKSLVTVVVLALAIAVLGVVQAQQPAVPPATSDPSTAAPSAPPPAPASGRQVLIDAGSLIGSAVRTPDGKDVGKVSALLIDPRDGRIATAVVSVGGVLGVGGSTVGVPWNALRIGQDKQRLVVTMEQNTLEQAPAASPPGSSTSDSTKK